MKKSLLIALCMVLAAIAARAQQRLYPNTFPLGQVELLDGPFRSACELNTRVLLSYDVDRLLAPYLKEAGLTPKAPSFDNWKDLDGHVGGHYLSALAIHYAATGSQQCRERMEYMLSQLRQCQLAHGDGYVGGVPNGDVCWREIRAGRVDIVWKYWVPWYNVHKMYAGLRDAWSYGGNELARQMFLEFCDWGLAVISPLSDEQMEHMLGNEFGGMDEVFADAYQMTGDMRYLQAAKRFSHRWLLDSMAKGVDNLDNKHANTQVPKVVGYQRIAELADRAGLSADAEYYHRAADFFWQTVVYRRSLALGGNSRREHFAAADDCHSYVEDREGPESCNTNNMLKLTEGLFRMRPDARYADFYERAMLNHILSTQHPQHGGYVYFTSARPAHYRVYSTPNSAMWCCVGTGMENHGKYGEFIYTRGGEDSLYVNLFVASRLHWAEKGITLTQQTGFPFQESSRLEVKVLKPVRASLLIRRPWWCADGEMRVVCRGKDYAAEGLQSSGYILIDRKWRDGDVVEISLPMQVTVEQIPNVSDYVAIMRGPVLMGARMGTQGLNGLVAGDGRWEHIAHGPLVSLFDTPAIIGTREQVLQRLRQMRPVPGKPMHFTVPGLFSLRGQQLPDLEIEPFFGIHDCRYMMYWLSVDQSRYDTLLCEAQAEEARKLAIDRRTLDAVTPGEQQPEVDHQAKHEGSTQGYFKDAPYRAAADGGYFQYVLATQGRQDLSLMVRYWGNETGARQFTILVDGQPLVEENLVGKWSRQSFVDAEYPLPAEMLQGKESVTVRFQSAPGTTAGNVYGVRLLRPAAE